MIVKKIYIKSLERSEISKKLFDYERGQFEFALLDENRVSVSCFEEFDRLTKNSKQFTDRERKRQLFRKFFPKGYYDLLSLLVEGDDDAIEFGRFAGCVSFVNGFIEGKEREKNDSPGKAHGAEDPQTGGGAADGKGRSQRTVNGRGRRDDKHRPGLRGKAPGRRYGADGGSAGGGAPCPLGPMGRNGHRGCG